MSKIILPKKWAVNRAPESHAAINEWINRMVGKPGEYTTETGYIHFPSFYPDNSKFKAGYHQDNCKLPGYEEISFDTFKFLVLVPFNVNEWSVLVENEEEFNEVLSWIKDNCREEVLDTHFSCCANDGSIISYTTTKFNFTGNKRGHSNLITLEQFRTLKSITMNKNTYICPMDLFDQKVAKGDLFVPVGGKQTFWRPEKMNDSQTAYHLPKEIVTKWEVAKVRREEAMLGTPKRNFIIESDTITMIDGSGSERVFTKGQVETVLGMFQEKPWDSFSVKSKTIQFGCDDGTTLTKDDIVLLQNKQYSLT